MSQKNCKISTAQLSVRVAVIFIAAAVSLLGSVSAFASDALERFLSSGTVERTGCAVLVTDLSGKKVIADHNIDKPLVPASINKVVTVASLLEKSGTDYCYETKIYAGGNISGGTLEGNLVVVGSGDPSLGAEDPKGSDIIADCVKTLRSKGVLRITGDVTVDNSIFPGPATPPSWQSGDLQYAYGAGCHGFNYCRNASGNHSVSNPAAGFTTKLRNAIVNAGIVVEGRNGQPSERHKLLMVHKSAPVSELMRSCMMRSDNLYAEAFMRTLALLNGKSGTTEAGAECENAYWRRKHLSFNNVSIIDGSGLSRSNRMTASFMAKVLRYMSDNVDYVSFFPLAGQEGTVKNFLKDTPLDSYIALKSGSMNGIQCYAGYLLDDDFAPTHIVVIMVNGFHGSRAGLKKAMGDMLIEMFRPDEVAGDAN